MGDDLPYGFGYRRTTMIDLIHVADTKELIYWSNVFRILGVKRCQSLLGQIGVPAVAISRPIHLMEAALYFWRQYWDGIPINGQRLEKGYADPGFPENYRLSIESLLQKCFAIIRDSYDLDTSISVARWARRFFVDQDQVNLWFTWSMIFASINSQAVSSEQASLLAQLHSMIKLHFGHDAQAKDARDLENCERIPLSNIERRMVALEVTQPTDVAEVNLTGLAKEILNYNHAYQIWRAIHADFKAESESLLWWGYERADMLGMPVEHVSIPVLQK